MTDDELRQHFDALRQDLRQQGAQIREELGQEFRQEGAKIREELGQEFRQEGAKIREELRQEFRQETATIREEFRKETGAIRQELRQETATIREEFRQETAAIREENVAAHVETRRYMDVVTEATHHEIRLVAEGVVLLREELIRTESRLDAKIDNSIAETRALIRRL
jgi:hypothetical protein